MDKRPLKTGDYVGIFGGGQLAMMDCEAARQLGLKTCVYAAEKSSCAFDGATKHICAPYDSYDDIKRFADMCKVATTEWENVPLQTIDHLAHASQGRVPFYPNRLTVATSQDRLLEKRLALELKIPIPRFWRIERQGVPANIVYPVILKTRRNGYDGKGQMRVNSPSEFIPAFEALGCVPCLAEEIVDFHFELSVIVANDVRGKRKCYSPFLNNHSEGILRETVWPIRHDHFKERELQTAYDIAFKFADHLDVVGLLAVEMFFAKDGRILFNELAPRPHNSGHITRDCAVTSQFSQHIRAIAGMPLGDFTGIHSGRMTNMIGDCRLAYEALDDPLNKRVYFYGKDDRAGRKVGHIVKFEYY